MSDVQEVDVFAVDDSTAIAIIGETSALSAIGGVDETFAIAESAPLHIAWDKKDGVWKTDMGDSESLFVSEFALRRCWAIWSDVVGQPVDIGYGVGPEGSEAGYAFVMNTAEFGVVVGQMFGVSARVMSAAAKIFTRSGELSFTGRIAIKTKFGLLFNPVVK